MKCINRFSILIVLALLILASCAESNTKTSNEKSISVKLFKIADGLHSPVSAVFAPDGSMLIAEQTGQIRLVKDNSLDADKQRVGALRNLFAKFKKVLSEV
jgi:glucose/arabinose dehydrogenase